MKGTRVGTRFPFAGLGIVAGSAIGLLVGMLAPGILAGAIVFGGALGLVAGGVIDLRRA
jgi:hypothetical protein